MRSNESGSQKVSFLAGDAHGTSTIVLDGTTQAVTRRYFTPFGADRGTGTAAWPDDKGFLSKPADKTTDLTHIGARQFDPAIGRFLSVDPLLETDKPQSLNGYTYAENNPATWADPSGQGSIKCGDAGNPCSPDVIASEETTAPPFTPTGNTQGSSGTSATNSSGNTCDAACLAAYYYRQWQIIKMQRERAALIAWRMGLGAMYANNEIFVHTPGKDCTQKCLTKLAQMKSDYFAKVSPNTPTKETKHLDDVIVDVFAGIDSVSNKVESWTAGAFYYTAAKAVGARCAAAEGGLMVCQSVIPIYGRGGTTIGHTYVTGYDPEDVDKPKLRHERVHTEQWDEHGLGFVYKYFSEGVDPCHNQYEEDAGWKDGDYSC